MPAGNGSQCYQGAADKQAQAGGYNGQLLAESSVVQSLVHLEIVVPVF